MKKLQEGIVHPFLVIILILGALILTLPFPYYIPGDKVQCIMAENCPNPGWNLGPSLLKRYLDRPTSSLPSEESYISSPPLNPNSDWNTYTNEEYGFETKYHPDSNPSERVGSEGVGQFTYLLLVEFGSVPLKSLYGYSLEVSRKTLGEYRSELVGHITDEIDSEEEITISGNSWTKINYQIYLTANYVPITKAFTNRGEYNYAITASVHDIDQILSTFKFVDQDTTSDFECPDVKVLDCSPCTKEPCPMFNPQYCSKGSAQYSWILENCPDIIIVGLD